MQVKYETELLSHDHKTAVSFIMQKPEWVAIAGSRTKNDPTLTKILVLFYGELKVMEPNGCQCCEYALEFKIHVHITSIYSNPVVLNLLWFMDPKTFFQKLSTPLAW